MRAMATDTEDVYSSLGNALPTPSDAPFRVRSRSRSRPGRRRRDSSPVTSPGSSYHPSHPLSPDRDSDLEDQLNTSNLSPLDPRRFTPTLHASLVSEILSLRREVENKTKVIDELERAVEDTRVENETLNTNLSESNKETKSLKHQLQLLEGGSSFALTELARERDEALGNVSEIRKKLEQTQKKARRRDEEVERTQSLWDLDKQSWEEERRNLERKVHVVENRLQIVLSEVAAVHAATDSLQKDSKYDGNDFAQGAPASRESDSASIHSSSQGRRRTSVTSISTDGCVIRNIRYSIMSTIDGHQPDNDGLTLAQELAFDEEGSDGLDDDSAPESPDTVSKDRPISVYSQLSSNSRGMKARKILGLSMDSSVDGGGGMTLQDYSVSTDRPGDHHILEYVSTAQANYQDAGVQYSPPPSPTPLADTKIFADRSGSSGPLSALNSLPRIEIESSGPYATSRTDGSSGHKLTIQMVSTSCQTIGALPSPPWTPKVTEHPAQQIVVPERVCTISTSTQTDETPTVAESNTRDESPDKSTAHIQIPTIAIHPPASEPPSPRNSVVLPPRTKSVSCQTNSRFVVEGRSVGIQTQEIRIDKRPIRLAASLLPSALPDLPSNIDSQAQNLPVHPYRAPPPRPGKQDRRPTATNNAPTAPTSESESRETKQAYPGNNDNGPLSKDSCSGIKRPFRSSSLFAGFGDGSDEATARAETDDFTDDDLLNRPFVSYTLRRGKLVSSETRSNFDRDPLSELDEPNDPASNVQEKPASPEHLRRPAAGDDLDSKVGGQRKPPVFGAKQPNIRRTAMISSGAAAHQKSCARSPSLPGNDSGGVGTSIAPPFPVPVRFSSRNVPVAGGEGQPSPSPSGNRNFSDRGGQTLVRRRTLRRVRSAAAIQAEAEERSARRLPTSLHTFPPEPASPEYPPMPFDDITAPHATRRRDRRVSPHRASSYFHHSIEQELMDSMAAPVQQTSVVDAIAQTMVGEWMYKYVRRRKSFGVGEAKDSWDGKNADEVSASITNGGSRHKRWVWLAPYERAVMWSSKQPTSGPALLGKNGRKLTIQSVLDVKDDNPLPKGAGPTANFHRSILILTPQRALKFTACSLERHFVWLTALSFLSHSDMGIHDLAALPPVPNQDDPVSSGPTGTATLRRLPIRDSIRVAKGKPRRGPNGKRSFASQPETVSEMPGNSLHMIPSMTEDDAADPPNVPRFSTHSRKRSNTASRIPAIRNFSSHATMPSNYSAGSSADGYTMHGPSTTSSHGITSGRSSFSRRTSEASGPSSTGTAAVSSHNNSNFFDAVGTVRMEAFVDLPDSSRPRSTYRTYHARKASSQFSSLGGFSLDSSSPRGYQQGDGGEGAFRTDDPFRGF